MNQQSSCLPIIECSLNQTEVVEPSPQNNRVCGGLTSAASNISMGSASANTKTNGLGKGGTAVVVILLLLLAVLVFGVVYYRRKYRAADPSGVFVRYLDFEIECYLYARDARDALKVPRLLA
jgi:hypothetical protein